VPRRGAGRARIRQRQRALKPARCQRRKVSGWTMRRTFLHVGVTAASATRTIRSNRAARPGNRALKDGALVAEQGDLCEQRPARAKGVRHGAGEHEDGFKHGRSKVTPTPWISRGSRRTSQDGGRARQPRGASASKRVSVSPAARFSSAQRYMTSSSWRACAQSSAMNPRAASRRTAPFSISVRTSPMRERM
jgi:hypothetical protein